MASLRQEIPVNAPLDHVWAALRDFGAVHRRLVPGFVVDSKLDGDARIVTFFNGMTVREELVSIDDAHHRVAYAIVGGMAKHYNGAAQVFAGGADKCRVVWTIDILPNELAGPIGEMQKQGARVMKETLDR